jgi:hypothetical protein
MNVSRPKQKLPFSQKDKDWKESNVRYWANRCNIFPVSNSDAIVLYSAVAGKLDESVYTYVTNPLNMDRPELKGYPAKIRNVDIISTNIQRLMGELAQRYFNPMVIALNSTMQDRKDQVGYELTVKKLKQDFVNGLVQEGMLPEQIAQTPMSQDLINKTVSNLQNELSKMGQHALNVIMTDKRIDLIRRKTLYDFIVLGRFFTYQTIHNDDIDYFTVSPLEMSFSHSPNIDFIQDAEAVKRTVTMTMNEIIDKFSGMDEFTDDIIDELETQLGIIGYNSISTGLTTDMLRGMAGVGAPYANQIEGLIVEHVQWSSMAEMIRVKGIDAFGNEYIEQYDEDYEPLPGEEVERRWVTQKWEGYRINNKHIIGVQPLAHQKGTWENPSRCKNEYNGRIYGNNYVIPQSIGEKAIVYQIKYNIAHYHLEKVMNKNKDKITTFPLGIIPQKEGWDEFTVMYYADAHGYLFIDETNPQALQALQYIKVLDMSLASYIKELYDILRAIKEDWDEAIGFNRQRKGATMASDGKAVTEEALYRSSTATEELFRQHEETILTDLNSLLPLTQIAWKDGKKGVYLSSKQKEVEYEIDPSVYPWIEYGVVAENSAKTQRDLELMKGQLGNIAQQTEQIGMLPRIVQAVNIAELIEDLDELESKLVERNQQQAAAEQEFKQAELAEKAADRELKRYEVDANIESAKDLKLMELEADLLGADVNNNGVPDVTEIAKLQAKREEAFGKIQLEREKLAEQRAKRLSDEKIAKEKLSVERYKASRPTGTKK